uniref:Ulp1 protease family, C-terminal catalytic domain n=2 Tax=Schistocephalus solidus TaxID=70667 RepID=A0A0X3PNT7_SCHSO
MKTMALDAQFFKPGARVMLRGTIDSSLTSRGPYVVRSLLPFRGRKGICRSIRTSCLHPNRFRVELATLSGVILDKFFNPQQLEPIVELDPEENSSSSVPPRVPRVLLAPGTAEEVASTLPEALPWRMVADEAPQKADGRLPPSKCSPAKRIRKCLSNSTAVGSDASKEYDILVLGPHHVTNLQLDVLQSGLGELADSIVNGFCYVLSRSKTFPCISEGTVELPSSLSLACILSAAARSPHGQDPDSMTVSVLRFYSLWRRWSERRLVLCPYLQAVSSGEESSNHWILLALSVRSRELRVFDSLGHDASAVRRFLKLLRQCNQCLLGVKEPWSLRTVRHNRQTDDNSCGLFVLGFIRRILGNGGEIPCSITVDVDDVRSYVLETLLTQTAPESSPATTDSVK